MKIVLPYPVSNNRNVRMTKKGMTPSKESLKYKKDVGWLAKAAGCKLHEGNVSVSVFLHPKMNKDGRASQQRIDLDNAFKCALDALNGIAWHDDKQVIRIYARVDAPMKNGGLSVLIDDC